MQNRYNLYNLEPQFRAFLLAENVSSITLKNYLSDFRYFSGWIELYLKSHQTKKPQLSLSNQVDLISKELISDYRSYLIENNLPYKTINRRLSTVRKFCSFCVSQGWMKENPAKKISNINKDITSHLTDSVNLEALQSPNKIFDNINLGVKIKSLILNLKSNFFSNHHSQNSQKNSSDGNFIQYIAFLIVLIFVATLGTGIYNQFFKKSEKSFAYPTTPTRAGRLLSFQGRLTDTLGNPITTATNVTFNLYNVSTGGTSLYTAGACSITPDQDGIFNVLIGGSGYSPTPPQDVCGNEIDSSIFSENANVYLGITVATDSEMTPRQQIANVGYAINAETLQGLPPGSEVSTIPYINQDGNMLIAASSPGIRSIYTSSTFTISSANATTIQSAGTGDVILQATESGTLKFRTGGIDDSVLKAIITNGGDLGVGTSGPDARIDSLATSGEQLRLTYTDGSVYTGFTVDNGGDLTIAPSGSDLLITGNIDTSGTLKAGTSDAFSVDSSGNTSIDNQGDIRLYEPDGAGTNYVGLQAPDTLAADTVYKLPNAFPGGASGYYLTSNTTGDMSWSNSISASSLKWNALTDPDGDLTLAMGTNNTIFNWDPGTSAETNISLTTQGEDTGSVDQVLLALSQTSNGTDTTQAADALLTLANNDANDPVVSAIKFDAGEAGTDFTYGINFDAASFGTAEIVLQNAETIDNVTDGVILLTASTGVAASSYLQVGGTSPTTYSRFGTNSSGWSLSGASDLLVSGDVEIDSQLIVDGASTNYLAGATGIGDISPDAKLEVLATTEQLRLTHTDDTHDAKFTVDGSGNLNIDVTGTKIDLADDLEISGTTGLTFSGTGGDITFTNGEKIDNDTDGTVNVTAETLKLTNGTSIVSDQTTVSVFDSTTTTLNIGSAATTINLADASITGTIDIGGVTNSGTTTVNIATNGTAADTIAIGNSNASTLLTLTGGDDWNISNTGILTLSASSAQTTAIVATDTDYTNALSVGDNAIIGTTGIIDYTNFDVDASGNIITTGDINVNGDNINADGTLSILGATGLTLKATTGTVTLDSIAASQTINVGASNVARTLNLGTGTGVDIINIGTGTTGSDVITIGGGVGTLAIDTGDWDIGTTGNISGIGTFESNSTTTLGDGSGNDSVTIKVGTGLFDVQQLSTTGTYSRIYVPSAITQGSSAINGFSLNLSNLTNAVGGTINGIYIKDFTLNGSGSPTNANAINIVGSNWIKDISLQNGETIDNDTNGKIMLTADKVETSSNMHIADNLTVNRAQIGSYLVTIGGTVCIDYNNNGTCDASWSDIRLKKDISDYSGGLDLIEQLNPVNFNFRYNEFDLGLSHEPQIGLIAQEVESILPQAVHDTDLGYKQIQYEKIVPVLISAVKEQQDEIDNISTKINKEYILSNFGDLQLNSSNYIYSGNLNIKNQKTEIKDQLYNLTSKTGEVISRIGAFSELLIAKIKSGLIETENAIVNNILIAKNIIVEEKISSPIIESTDIIATREAKLNNIQTNEIQPENKDLAINLSNDTLAPVTEEKGELAKLIIKGLEGKIVTTIDTSGNASFSGQIIAQSLNINNDATVSGSLAVDKLQTNEASISGTLIAKNIESENINSLTKDVFNTQTNINEIQSLIADIKNQPIIDPSNYQNINSSETNSLEGNLTLENLTVTGMSNQYNTSISNSLLVGITLVEQNSIISLSSELKLSALEKINLFDGNVIIAKDGTITTQGELIAKGGIRTDEIKPLIDDGQVEIDNLLINNLEIKDKYLEATSSSAIIAAPENFKKNGIFAPAIETATTSAGIAIIPENSSEVIVYNNNIKKDSLIYLTPTSSSANSTQTTLTVIDKSYNVSKPYFKVNISTPSILPVRFNWLIIN